MLFNFYLAKVLENILYLFFRPESFIFIHIVKGGETDLIWDISIF